MDHTALLEYVKILVSIDKAKQSILAGNFTLGVAGEAGESTLQFVGENSLDVGNKLIDVLGEYEQSIENRVRQYVRPSRPSRPSSQSAI